MIVNLVPANADGGSEQEGGIGRVDPGPVELAQAPEAGGVALGRAVGAALGRVLPVQVEPVVVDVAHVLHRVCDELLDAFVRLNHIGETVRTMCPAADGKQSLRVRVFFWSRSFLDY